MAGEARITRSGSYVEAKETPALVATRAGALVELKETNVASVTRAGANVEVKEIPALYFSRAGAYVELEIEATGGKITRTGAYLEFEIPWADRTSGPFNPGRRGFIFTNRAAAHITRRKKR